MTDHDALRDQLFAFYDGELSGESRRSVERHLEACAECRGRLDRWRQTARRVFETPQAAGSDAAGADASKLADSEATEAFVSRVMARIERAEQPRRAPSWIGGLRWLAPALGLAGLVFVIGQTRQQDVSVDMLLADSSDPSAWMLSSRPASADDVLGFVMEER